MEDNAFRLRRTNYGHQQFNSQVQANPRNRSKSCSHFLLKFLFIALFLCVLPLFPSEAPEFISHTIFAKTWELFHLLIIGIALSYGLFCRPKTPQTSPSPQISQPYGTNILNHSSIFDYKNDNPSGFLEKNAIPTQSCDLPYYRTEPYVVVRKNSCTNVIEKPLGLPIRSLRSRVLDSDSSNSDGDEECGSECESDLCGKDENLEGFEEKSTPRSWNSRPMRVDFMAENGSAREKYEPEQLKFQSFRSPTQASCQKNSIRVDFMAENGNVKEKYEAEQLKSQSFRSPTQASCQKNSTRVDFMAEDGNVRGKYEPEQLKSESFRSPIQASCQINYGFCSWLPNSPNLHQQQQQQHPMWIPPLVGSPNMEGQNSWRGDNYGMPFSEFSTQGNDFSMMGMPPHLEQGNLSVEKPMFFVPSAAAPASMPAIGEDCSSRSGEYSHENVNLGQASNLENGILGGNKANISMPSSAAPSSVSVPDKDFASSIKPSRSRKFSHERGDSGKLSSLESGTFGGEKTSSFMPSVAVPSSVSVPDKQSAPSIKPSRSRKFNHENGDMGKSSNLESENVGGEKTNPFMTSVAAPSSVSVSDKKNSPSMKPSRSRKFNHENGELGKSPNLQSANLGGEQINSSMPSDAPEHLVSGPEKDFSSSIKPSRARKLSQENRSFDKLPKLESENLGGEKTNSFMPSVAAPSSVSVPDKNFASSIKPSRSRRVNHKNGALGKSLDLEGVNLGGEQISSFMPSDAPQHSVPGPENDLASSIKRSRSRRNNPKTAAKKDEQGLENDNVASVADRNGSSTPHFVDPNSVPTPRHDFASTIDGSFLKKEEQKSIPERWDDDCFVIPSSETNDVGDVVQENLLHAAASSEPALSAGVSSRRSSTEQGLSQSEVEEIVPFRTSTNASEIEELEKDKDAYKPSTPSPPPRVQTRRDDFASSVESSSNALGKGSLFSEDDDQGSPSTPEREKALLRASHSRRFSCGSFFDRDLRRSFSKNEGKEANKKSKGSEKYARGAKCGWDCLKLDVRPKAALKGRSVRTIKPREIPLEIKDQRELPEGQKNGHVEQKLEENGAPSMERTGEKRGEKKEMVVIQIGITEKRSSSNGRKGEKKQGNSETSIIVGLNSQERSKGKVAAVSEIKEVETDSDEIDKKASEFIAKFKEQIRLQKVAAMAGSSRQQYARQS